jgi:predicted RecB family endonuclease
LFKANDFASEFSALQDEGVESIADLLILKIDDLKDIVKQAIPRRKIMELIKSLRDKNQIKASSDTFAST